MLPLSLPKFVAKIKELVASEKVSNESKLLLVNDGSKDSTWDLIKKFSEENEEVEGICLSKNRGQQNAIIAGLNEAEKYADIVITMDCDGQDPIPVINEMVDKYYEGFDIVYAARNNRDTDSWFKRTTSNSYYFFMKLLGVNIVPNHAEYRLVTKEVLKSFDSFSEVNVFLRGLFPYMGFKNTIIYYKRECREAGESKYPLRKMIALAWDSITNFSTKPITAITTTGIIISILSFIAIIWSIICRVKGISADGWASLCCIVCLLGGLQLVSIGVIGEYLGKTYLEAKKRPRYFIMEKTYKG